MHFDDDTGLAVDAVARGLGVALWDELSARPGVAKVDRVLALPGIELTRRALIDAWARTNPKANVS
jgi:hypothetical protein